MPAEKTVQIHFRVTSSEYESIKNNADKSGLSLSEYARRSLVGEKVMAAPPVEFGELIREIKRIGSNLNQVLRKLNALGIAHPLELERCAENITGVINMLYQTFRPGKGDK